MPSSDRPLVFHYSRRPALMFAGLALLIGAGFLAVGLWKLATGTSFGRAWMDGLPWGLQGVLVSLFGSTMLYNGWRWFMRGIRPQYVRLDEDALTISYLNGAKPIPWDQIRDIRHTTAGLYLVAGLPAWFVPFSPIVIFMGLQGDRSEFERELLRFWRSHKDQQN